MNLSAEEQECIGDAFTYYDNAGDGKIGVSQVSERLERRQSGRRHSSGWLVFALARLLADGKAARRLPQKLDGCR